MSKTAAEIPPGRAAAAPEELELAQLIVTALNLDVPAAEIDPAAPLYSEGLGLDSIDILENGWATRLRARGTGLSAATRAWALDRALRAA